MSERDIAEFSWTAFDQFLMKFGYKKIRWFKLINSSNHLLFPGRMSSKTGRKVVQENCEAMATFHCSLIVSLITGSPETYPKAGLVYMGVTRTWIIPWSRDIKFIYFLARCYL